MIQKYPGKALQVLVDGHMDEILPNNDGSGVDIFIENNDYRSNERVYLYDLPIPASGSEVTSITYQVTRSLLLKGYGGEKSRTCTDEGDRRRVCNAKKNLQEVFKYCDFCTKVQYASYFGFSDNETEQFYGAFGCDVNCVNTTNVKPVSFAECPSRCIDVFTTTVGYYPVQQTKYQKKLYSLLFGSDKKDGVTDVRIGIETFDVHVIKQSPAQTLGGLIGTVGGNLNLWFGPDFMSAVWFLELIIFGSIYSRYMPLPNIDGPK